jgi:hypothetical protein
MEVAGVIPSCTGVLWGLPGTIYRVNLLYTQGATGPKKLTVCDQYLNVLVTQSASTGSGSNAPNHLTVGFLGEEPTVAGYLYQSGDFVVDSAGTLFSTSACF